MCRNVTVAMHEVELLHGFCIVRGSAKWVLIGRSGNGWLRSYPLPGNSAHKRVQDRQQPPSPLPSVQELRRKSLEDNLSKKVEMDDKAGD